MVTRHGKVPFSIKAAYGTSSVADGIKNGVFNSFLLFYYTGVLGLPGSLAGTALFLAMCFDAISDPLVGYLSDHTHSRLGRRHPYMYAAAIPMGISVYLLLAPPADLGNTGLFAWMTALSISVRLAITLNMIPRGALVPEITYDYDERTSLVAAGYFMGWCGMLGLSQIAWLLIIPSTEGGRMAPEAYRQIGMVAGVASATAILASAAGTHRIIPELRKPDAVPVGFRAFLGEIKNAFSNHSFRMIMIGGVIVSVAGNFQEVFGLYMNTYFWEFEDGDIARLALLLGVAVLLATFGVRRLSQLSDKRRTVIGLGMFLFLWAPLTVLGRFAGLMPENSSPWLLWIVVGHLAVAIVPFIAISILLSSMFKDIVDEIELDSGRRQEGLIGAAIAFMLKAVAGVGNLMGGIAIEMIDFPTQAAPGAVPPEKVFWLGMVAGPGLMIVYVLGFVFLSRYSITRERFTEIRAALDARARESKPTT